MLLSDLKQSAKNPRKISRENLDKLKKSISEFPKGMEFRGIVYDDWTKEILIGNQRYKALLELGYTEIPDSWTRPASSLTEDEKKRLQILDNVSYGSWDADILANDWDFSELENWAVDFAFEEIQIPQIDEELFGMQDSDPVIGDDDFEMPNPKEVKTDIVAGDLLEIGSHRLICGSCTEAATFAQLMQNKQADLILTDPPYNVNYQGGAAKNRAKIANDNLSDEHFEQFLNKFYSLSAAHTKMGAAWYVFHADSYGYIFRNEMKKAGISLKQCLIWVKQHFVLGRQDYQWQHEPILYGWIEGKAHKWRADRKQTTILNFDKPQRNAEHPTMKPIELLAYLMGNSSDAGDVVLDPFLGSGSTMVAAEQLGRVCFGVELEPKYCQVIVERMKRLNPELEVRKNGVVWDTTW